MQNDKDREPEKHRGARADTKLHVRVAKHAELDQDNQNDEKNDQNREECRRKGQVENVTGVHGGPSDLSSNHMRSRVQPPQSRQRTADQARVASAI